ncbi:hypothetical protein BKA65DRAFT_556335 [Rhexocercosporidium sp. MPI-PUGE-AT-0058]|nr:hypothetical protein BKA65DRAFT_556335 [Rhexocercosporidium sp. MPI-PUGE-AT-0058]
MPGTTQGLLSSPTGRKQLLFPERAAATARDSPGLLSTPSVRGDRTSICELSSCTKTLGAAYTLACTNLLRKLNDEYDRAFEDVDLLVMPTIIYPPPRIEERGGRALGPLKMLSRAIGATYNTATFNSTGHQALSLPVGFVSSRVDGDENVWLPTGLQIVGREFEIAASLEGVLEWRGKRFGGHGVRG